MGNGREALLQDVQVPDYLRADGNSDWHYYVHDTGDLEDSFGPIGEPEEYVYERVWMRPIPGSALDPEDREDGEPTVERGPDGRFRPRYWWIECHENDRGAVAFYGARYA